MTPAPSSLDELSRALLPVAADPNQIPLLYEHLREFCHDARGQLNLLRMKLYMARQETGPDVTDRLEELEERYRRLECFVVRLHTICRPMRPLRMDVPLNLVFEERRLLWAEWLAARGRRLLLSPPKRPVRGSLDPDLLGDALDAFVTWRVVRGADHSEVCVRWKSERGRIRICWDERPGTTASPACISAGRVPCLGLVLLARVLSTHGGSLSIDESEGFCLNLYLPAVGTTDGFGLDQPDASSASTWAGPTTPLMAEGQRGRRAGSVQPRPGSRSRRDVPEAIRKTLKSLPSPGVRF